MTMTHQSLSILKVRSRLTLEARTQLEDQLKSSSVCDKQELDDAETFVFHWTLKKRSVGEKDKCGSPHIYLL